MSRQVGWLASRVLTRAEYGGLMNICIPHGVLLARDEYLGGSSIRAGIASAAEWQRRVAEFAWGPLGSSRRCIPASMLLIARHPSCR